MFGKEKFFIQEPRASFFAGFAAGIGVFALIGFIILLVNYFGDGSSIKNISSKKTTTTNTENGDTVLQGPSGPVDIKVTDDDHIQGDLDKAKITIVEFSDFQCPFCQSFHPTLEKIVSEYGNDVAWVYKHFPLDSIHPNARPAAEASECAAEQDKFWEFAGKLFENQSRLGTDYYKELASELGLNTKKFNSCVDSGKYKDKVESDYQEGVAAGVRGTPGSFINGQPLNGAQPYETVKAAIDSLL